METSTFQSASILLFGQDSLLVETRQWVLERSGFRLLTALSLTELHGKASEEAVQLFLLCDSLTIEMRTRALAMMHSSWPGTKRLVLAPSSVSAEFAPNEEVFPAMEGPRNLITTIRTLIVNGPVSAT